MKRSAFLKIPDVVKFIEDVFGEKQPFVIEGGGAVVRNEGRRQEDSISMRTFLDHQEGDLVFTVTIAEEASSRVPEVFSNPDYMKILRNRYREINRAEIQFWKIDFTFSRPEKADGPRHEITFRFTVRYVDEL